MATGEPIRILHVIGIMNRGGAETMIMNLYRQIDRVKIQFDFVENCSEKAAFDDEIRSLGGRIYHCPHYNGINHFQYCSWWKHFFQKHREYRIVHGHIGSTASIYLSEAKKHGIFTIAHSHSAGTDYSLKNTLYKVLSFRTRYVADYFFACSDKAGKDRFGQKITLQGNYRVLPNAIDARTFEYSLEMRKRVRKDLNLENQMIIGHVGRFDKPKNQDFLIELLPEVLKKNPDVVLVLVGDGPLKAQIEYEVQSRNLCNSVFFLGVREDVNMILQAVDVFVFPSLYEGLGIAVIEAQAAGLPCIISNKLPQDCVVNENLVEMLSLSLPKSEWANRILRCFSRTRTSGYEAVIRKGYDIHQTVGSLERFYREHWNG